EEKDGVNCPEPLTLSPKSLCARTQPDLNPQLTGALALATIEKPLTSGALVDVKIVAYAPGADLAVQEADLDLTKPGPQIGVEPDGSVRFHLVAGEKTGYYEVHVTGDLDTANGDLTVENCEPTLTSPQNPPPKGHAEFR